MFYYDVRHDDLRWEPETIEKRVDVNYFGHIISKKELEFEEGKDFVELSEKESKNLALGGKIYSIKKFIGDEQ